MKETSFGISEASGVRERPSGVLNEASERCLVTDDMKKEINLETRRLRCIIEDESYLTCIKALMEKSGELG